VVKLIKALRSESITKECVKAFKVDAATLPVVVEHDCVDVPPAVDVLQIVTVWVEPVMHVSVLVVPEAETVVEVTQLVPLVGTLAAVPRIGASTIRVGRIPEPLVKFTL